MLQFVPGVQAVQGGLQEVGIVLQFPGVQAVQGGLQEVGIVVGHRLLQMIMVCRRWKLSFFLSATTTGTIGTAHEKSCKTRV